MHDGPRNTLRALLAALLLAALACGCRGGGLTPGDAARALRASPVFTQRAGSHAGRELVEILVVRPLGRTSAEVEFTWRDAPGPGGTSSRPLRSSMALFKKLGDGTWSLAMLYKVS